MFKNSENTPDTKHSKSVAQIGPHLHNSSNLEHETSSAEESKDRSLRWVTNLTTSIEPILVSGPWK